MAEENEFNDWFARIKSQLGDDLLENHSIEEIAEYAWRVGSLHGVDEGISPGDRVTLVIEDLDEGVRLTLTSSPPYDLTEGAVHTESQIVGIVAMEAIRRAGDPEEDGV